MTDYIKRLTAEISDISENNPEFPRDEVIRIAVERVAAQVVAS